MSDSQFGILIGLIIGATLVILAVMIRIFFAVLSMRRYFLSIADLLPIAKTYYEMGRSQHQDTCLVLEKVSKQADLATATSLTAAVNQVPQKTADKVAEMAAEAISLMKPQAT